MQASSSLSAFVCVVMTSLAGCGGSAPPPTPPAVPPAAAPAAATSAPPPAEPVPAEPRTDSSMEGESLERIMQAHFEDASAIRQAVIAGRPEDASAPAAELARSRDLDHLPEGWRGFVERMQQVARRIEGNSLVSLTARSTADLGVVCGLCHQQRGGPHASLEPAPARGSTVESLMQRHAWATERLWEGLYVPSDEAWEAGAQALGNTPFPSEVLQAGGVQGRAAATAFTRLVVKAPALRSPFDRADLYAGLLQTCGSCHRAAHDSH